MYLQSPGKYDIILNDGAVCAGQANGKADGSLSAAVRSSLCRLTFLCLIGAEVLYVPTSVTLTVLPS